MEMMIVPQRCQDLNSGTPALTESVAATQGPGKAVRREDLDLYCLGLWSRATGGFQAL